MNLDALLHVFYTNSPTKLVYFEWLVVNSLMCSLGCPGSRKKSDKASKKENDCNVSQVSLDVNPVPVMYIFGVFRQFLAIFDPKRSPSTLSTLGLGGVTKGTKNRFGTVFSYFRGLQSLIFWRFSAIFGYFRPQKVTIGPFDPGFGGVTKVTKIDITPG